MELATAAMLGIGLLTAGRRIRENPGVTTLSLAAS